MEFSVNKSPFAAQLKARCGSGFRVWRVGSPDGFAALRTVLRSSWGSIWTILVDDWSIRGMGLEVYRRFGPDELRS